MKLKSNSILAITLGLLIDFAVLAQAAHDLWAATVVYVIVLILFLFVLWIYAGREQSPGISLPLMGPALLVLLAFFISFHGAVNPSESFMALMDWIAGFMLFYISVQIFVTFEIVWLLIVTVFPVFFIQLFLHAQQLIQWTTEFKLLPTHGSLINPNVSAAFYLMWASAFFGAVSQFHQSSRKKIIAVAGLSLVLLLIILTKSAAGLVCLLGGIYFSKRIKAHPGAKVSSRLLHRIRMALIVIAFVIILFKLGEALRGKTFFENIPYSNRYYWWLTAIQMFRDHPWFGIGLGNYPSAYLAYKVGPVVNTLYSHNFYVGLIGETGLLGFLSMAFFLGHWFFLAIKLKDSGHRWSLALGVILFLALITVNVGMEYLVNLMSCFILAGAALSGISDSYWKPRKSILIIITALAVSAIPFLMSPLLASQQEVYAFENLKGNKDTHEAEKCFISAIKLDSRSYRAPLGLAKIHIQRYLEGFHPEDLTKAIFFQEKAVERNKLSARMWWELSTYYELQGETLKTLHCLQKAVAYEGSNKKYKKDLEDCEKRLKA